MKTEVKLPVTESILVAVSQLIDAKIGLHVEMTRETLYPMSIDGSKARVRAAEHKLMMALDDLAHKDELPRRYSGACGPL